MGNGSLHFFPSSQSNKLKNIFLLITVPSDEEIKQESHKVRYEQNLFSIYLWDSLVWIPWLCPPSKCSCVSVSLSDKRRYTWTSFLGGKLSSDSLWHFLIMVWCPESFSPSHHHSEAQEKCHYSTCHYKSKRKNKIDWKPRGLWITYLSSFISTLAGASMMFHLYKKIAAFLTISRKPLWVVGMVSWFASKKQIAQFAKSNLRGVWGVEMVCFQPKII